MCLCVCYLLLHNVCPFSVFFSVSPGSPLAVSSVGGVSMAGTSLDGHTLDEDSMGSRDPGGGDGRNGGEGCEDDSLQIHLHYPKPAAVSFLLGQREREKLSDE